MAAGDRVAGEYPRIIVYADGQMIYTRYMQVYKNGQLDYSRPIKASHAEGQTQTLQFRLAQVPQKIEIAFINAYADSKQTRDLYIYSLSVNNVTYLPAQAIYDSGSITWADSTSLEPGHAAMSGGKLVFTLNQATAPVANSKVIVLTPANAVNGIIDVASLNINACLSGQSVTVQGDGKTAVNVPEPAYWPNKIERLNANTVQIIDQHGCSPVITLVNVPQIYFADSAPMNTAAITAVYGSCGSANGAVFSARPTANLCSAGTPSAMSTAAPWTWSCIGNSNGGNANCAAQLPAPVNGSCGAATASYSAAAPAINLCASGSVSAVAGTGPWSWSCNGLYGGSSAACQAKPYPPTNGACGYSNGAILNTAPLAGLCASGTASTVSGAGPWTWSCAGINGGTTSPLCAVNPGPAVNGNVLAVGSLMTPAATAEQVQLCANKYPTQWEWDPAQTMPQPRAALPSDNLTPMIQQVRNGTVIATWQYLGAGGSGCSGVNLGTDQNPEPVAAAGCGPFGRSHQFQTWQPGDTFLVYPAVYNADSDPNQPYIGPNFATQAQYDANTPNIPTNITIQGVTVNGIRPVFRVDSAGGASDTTLGQGIFYIAQSVGLTIENIDIDTTNVDNRAINRAGIYLYAAKDLTLRQMRIHGLADANANGIFGSIQGTLTLDQMEFYDDGGQPDDYAHNVYISIDPTDPNYDPNATVHMTNSWSHGAYMGHLFKSRVANAILEGNYFEGGLPQAPQTLAEDYDVDISNGGTLIARNNIFTKNQSGYGENGISLAYAMEGVPDSRALSIDIENNTFVAFSQDYDNQGHVNFPMSFFYPSQVPGTAGFPVPNVVVKQNAFVGYCTQNNPVFDYRGDLAVSEAFSETNLDFSFSNKILQADTSIIGTLAYKHQNQGGLLRSSPVIGARD